MSISQSEKPSDPADSGFRMPAEWEPHLGTWMAWPHLDSGWHNNRYEDVWERYTLMIAELLRGERVFLLIRDASDRDIISKRLDKFHAETDKLVFFQQKTADVWIRDYGPTFVLNKTEKAWCKWEFNAWGNKYEDLLADNLVFTKNSGLVSSPCFEAGIILEGGSIEVNGAGLCMVTEQCLLNRNRNKGLSKKQIEEKLGRFIGADEFIWLKDGIAGDDTDGHIDDIARFVSGNKIVTCVEEDKSDENYRALKENLNILREFRPSAGGSLEILTLPMPDKVISQNKRLPASYANFYVANACVLLPVFGAPQDGEVISMFKELFPERKIIPVESTPLVLGLGTIHCMTQQEPDLSGE